MKKMIIMLLIVLFPASVFGHPGKTDNRGGHKCWKSCDEWALEVREYHLHDEGWKPIRLDVAGNPITAVKAKKSGPAEEGQKTGQDVVLPKEQSTEATVPVIAKAPAPVVTGFGPELTEKVFFNPLLFLACIALIFLLLLLFLLKRKREN